MNLVHTERFDLFRKTKRKYHLTQVIRLVGLRKLVKIPLLLQHGSHCIDSRNDGEHEEPFGD